MIECRENEPFKTKQLNKQELWPNIASNVLKGCVYTNLASNNIK